MQMSSELIQVAKIGKAVGLRGELKLHLISDFIEQFQADEELYFQDRSIVTIDYFNHKRSLIKFKTIDDRESAKALTNKILYTTKERSKEICTLDKNEIFWFDLIGYKIIDNSLYLGEIKEIDRINGVDYLFIQTSEELLEKKMPKSFLIPYIDEYIENFDREQKRLFTKNALLLLEAS